MRKLRKRPLSLKPENLAHLPQFAEARKRELHELPMPAMWIARRFGIAPAFAKTIAASLFAYVEDPNG